MSPASMELTAALGVLATAIIGVLWRYLNMVVPVLVRKLAADLNATQLRQIDTVVSEGVLLAQQMGIQKGLTNEAKKLLAQSHVGSELERLGIDIDFTTLGNKIEAEVASLKWDELFGKSALEKDAGLVPPAPPSPTPQ